MLDVSSAMQALQQLRAIGPILEAGEKALLLVRDAEEQVATSKRVLADNRAQAEAAQKGYAASLVMADAAAAAATKVTANAAKTVEDMKAQAVAEIAEAKRAFEEKMKAREDSLRRAHEDLEDKVGAVIDEHTRVSKDLEAARAELDAINASKESLKKALG